MAAKVKDNLLRETCRCCDGAGEIVNSTHANDPYAMVYVCPLCLGEGEVHPDDNMTLERYEDLRRADYDAMMEGKRHEL